MKLKPHSDPWARDINDITRNPIHPTKGMKNQTNPAPLRTLPKGEGDSEAPSGIVGLIHESFPAMGKINPAHEGSKSSSPQGDTEESAWGLYKPEYKNEDQ